MSAIQPLRMHNIRFLLCPPVRFLGSVPACPTQIHCISNSAGNTASIVSESILGTYISKYFCEVEQDLILDMTTLNHSSDVTAFPQQPIFITSKFVFAGVSTIRDNTGPSLPELEDIQTKTSYSSRIYGQSTFSLRATSQKISL